MKTLRSSIYLFIFFDFTSEILPHTQRLHLDMRQESPLDKGNSFSNPAVQEPTEVFKTNFQPTPIEAVVHRQPPNYREVARVLKTTTFADVYTKASPMYMKKLHDRVKNGMCRYMRPDMVVMPKSTEDVSKIVKTAAHYNTPLSVRSGGHSYTCQSLKPGNILIYLHNNVNANIIYIYIYI